MVIKFVQGANIFDIEADTVVIPVNCVGVMGKGLAFECKKKYPRVFWNYKSKCDDRSLRPGKVQFCSVPINTDDVHLRKNFILFPTKDHWMDMSRIDYIRDGLNDLVKELNAFYPNIKTVAFPKLGCGLGGLRWIEVRQVMVDILSQLDRNIIICV